MLHPAVVGDLLEMEAVVAREQHGHRFSSLEVVNTDVICTINDTSRGLVRIRLDGARYDSEPFGVTVIDDADNIVPQSGWPGSLCYGRHPTLDRPFACVRGTFEYHTYPGHNQEPWDAYRHLIHMTDLLDHVLRKAGK